MSTCCALLSDVNVTLEKKNAASNCGLTMHVIWRVLSTYASIVVTIASSVEFVTSLNCLTHTEMKACLLAHVKYAGVRRVICTDC